jgi:hypothetical protein
MEKKKSLFNLSQEMYEITEELARSDGEITELIESRFVEIENAISQKTDGLAHVLEAAQSQINLAKSKLVEKKDWIVRAEKSIERLKSYIVTCMNRMDIKEISGEDSRLFLKKPSSKVEVFDDKALSDYDPTLIKNEIKVISKPDLIEIKKRLNQGESIPGARLVKQEEKLEIKQPRIM